MDLFLIYNECLSELDAYTIITGARKDNEKPMGYLLSYLKDTYYLPKIKGCKIAEKILKHFEINNSIFDIEDSQFSAIAQKYGIRYEKIDGKHCFEIEYILKGEIEYNNACVLFWFIEAEDDKFHFWKDEVHNFNHHITGPSYSPCQPMTFDEILTMVDQSVNKLAKLKEISNKYN